MTPPTERERLIAWWAKEARECTKLDMEPLAAKCLDNETYWRNEPDYTLAELIDGIGVLP